MKPVALVGREQELEDWDVSLDRATDYGFIDAPHILCGHRGVGKTVLLAEMARIARNKEWVVCQLEAKQQGKDLQTVLGGGTDSGALEIDVKKLIRGTATELKEQRRGLAVLIDEAQDLDKEELAALASCAQMASIESLPFLLVLIGLPILKKKLTESKSYAERFSFKDMERLNEDDAR